MQFVRQKLNSRSDEELMLLLTRGKQSAFDELYKRYSKPLFNFFFRLMDFDRAKAEDLLHDLFLKLIEKNVLFDGTKSFKTWLYTIAGNLVKNEYRQKTVRRSYLDAQQEKPDISTTEQVHTIDKQLFNKRLQEELKKMTAEERLLIQLRYVEEMSVKQLAETLALPEGTVKSRLHNLTRFLSEKLSTYSYN